MCFAFAIGTLAFSASTLLPKSIITVLGCPSLLFRSNIVAFEIIADESAAMNMLQDSCYFSENSIPYMFLAPTYFEVPRKKITYRLFDTNIFKVALQKQTILPLKEQVHWSGDCELNEPFPEVDPRDLALAAAKSSTELIGKDLEAGLPLRVI